MSKRGNLYVISAPSGTGKTTLVNTLVKSLNNITISISHTTRPKRPVEIDGTHYYFVDKNKFEHMVQHEEFLEHALVFDHLYGTSRAWVEDTLKRGIDVILEIDWQGCQQIRRLCPDCVSIFILPPSLSALSQRLTQRNQDKPQVIEKRLADAQKTIMHVPEYDYIVINDDLHAAVGDLKTIIQAGRLRRYQQIEKLSPLLTELTSG